MFATAQWAYVFADTLNFLAATRYNLDLGIPDPLLYFFGGQVARFLEFGLSFFASVLIFSALIPPGIESTLQSMTMTICIIGFFISREIIGVLMNHFFVQMTIQNMSQYYYLRLIALICSCMPLTYMWRIVPTLAEVKDVQARNFNKKEKSALEEQDDDEDDKTA